MEKSKGKKNRALESSCAKWTFELASGPEVDWRSAQSYPRAHLGSPSFMLLRTVSSLVNLWQASSRPFRLTCNSA